MFGLGFQELLIVGVVAVVLFGKRLPEVAKSLGASYREFRQGLSEIQSQIDFTGSSYSSRRTSSLVHGSLACRRIGELRPADGTEIRVTGPTRFRRQRTPPIGRIAGELSLDSFGSHLPGGGRIGYTLRSIRDLLRAIGSAG